MLWTLLQVDMTLVVVVHHNFGWHLLGVKLERLLISILFDYFDHQEARFFGNLAHPCLQHVINVII